SSPRTTRTLSPFVTCSVTRSALSTCRARLTTLERPAFRYFRIRISDDLGRQRDDLHVLLLAELARHWTEDSCRARLALFVDDEDRVLVEADVAAVLAAGLLGRADDHRPRDVGFFHGAVRQRVLHRDDHDVAQARITPAGAAEHANDLRRLRAGVVRHLDHRFLLDHRSSPGSAGAVDDLEHA